MSRERCLALQFHRERPDWTHTRIAQEVGVSRDVVGNWFRDERQALFPPGEFIGTSEAARRLGISPWMVCRLAQRGELKGERFGPAGAWMFRVKEVESLAGGNGGRLLGSREVANVLGVSQSGVALWAISGRLRGIQTGRGGSWLFRWEDVETLAHR